MLQFLKMYPVLQASLLGTPLNSFSGRLPKWGTYSNGAIWPLQTLGHPTAVPAGSVWPTMTANTGEHPGQIKHKPGQQLRLSQAVHSTHWATPSSSEPQLARRAGQGQHILTKNGTVRRLNPDGTQSNLGLSAQVNWAIPTKQDGENNAGPSQFLRNSQPLNVQAAGKAGAKLNPDWVESLMGFPIGWTNIAGPPVLDNRNTHGNRRASWKARRNIVLPASRHSAMRLSHRSSTRLHAKLWRGYKRRKALQND